MNSVDKNRSQGRLAKYLLVSYAIRRASYIIRALAGAYLVYLMYELFSEAGTTEEELTVWMAAIGVLMMAAGIYFVIGGAYALLNGIYAENEPIEEPEAAKGLEATADGKEAAAGDTAESVDVTET